MKTIHNFILEKLKLNNQSQVWSIKDAKKGDIITIQYGKIKITFIFRCFYKTVEWGEVVRVCGYFNYNDRMFFIVEERDSSHVGTVKEYFDGSTKYWKATPKEKYTLFNAAAKEGYKWNSTKKEFECV